MSRPPKGNKGGLEVAALSAKEPFCSAAVASPIPTRSKLLFWLYTLCQVASKGTDQQCHVASSPSRLKAL
jgi:hypothetical protein